MKAILTKSLLKRLYTDLEKTDKEIANFLALDRTTIVHARKRFGIKARLSVGRKGELTALKELDRRGFHVVDMNRNDKLSEFDVLVNDKCRVEVKSASEYKGRFYFVLTESSEVGNLVSNKRIRLENGRTRKLFSKTCDFLLFVGFPEKKAPMFWVIPSIDIPDERQGVSTLVEAGEGKYNQYAERFDLLGEPIERGEIA